MRRDEACEKGQRHFDCAARREEGDEACNGGKDVGGVRRV